MEPALEATPISVPSSDLKTPADAVGSGAGGSTTEAAATGRGTNGAAPVSVVARGEAAGEALREREKESHSGLIKAASRSRGDDGAADPENEPLAVAAAAARCCADGEPGGRPYRSHCTPPLCVVTMDDGSAGSVGRSADTPPLAASAAAAVAAAAPSTSGGGGGPSGSARGGVLADLPTLPAGAPTTSGGGGRGRGTAARVAAAAAVAVAAAAAVGSMPCRGCGDEAPARSASAPTLKSTLLPALPPPPVLLWWLLLGCLW